MQLSAPWFLFTLLSLSSGRSVKTYEKFSFSGFQSLRSVASRFSAGPSTNHTLFHRNQESILAVACITVLFFGRIKVGWEECSSLRKMLNSKCFQPFVFFLPGFLGRQKSEVEILKLHEMMKVSLVITCLIVFILFGDLGGHG